MIILISALAGIIWGAYQAKRRGGNRKDMAQYAFGYGVAFALVGLFASILIERALT